MIDTHHGWNTNLKPLIAGFIWSIILTLGAYLIVSEHLLSNKTILIATVLGLAFVQGVVQLIFFLHLLLESKPRWSLMIFLFFLLIMVVVVVGSIWIMAHLNYNMMIDMKH